MSNNFSLFCTGRWKQCTYAIYVCNICTYMFAILICLQYYYLPSTFKVMVTLDVPKLFLPRHVNSPESLTSTEGMLNFNFC